MDSYFENTFQITSTNLYLSQKVDKKSIELINNIHSSFNSISLLREMPHEPNSGRKEILDELDVSKEKVKEGIEQLTLLLKSELSIGYYNSESNEQ